MTTVNLMLIVSLLIALSGASERLTEIIKGALPFLNNESTDATYEGFRRAGIQLLAVLSGIGTAFLSKSVIDPILTQIVGGNEQNWSSTPAIFALGLLASFGAGFWNSILEYLLKTKDIKELTAKKLAEKPNELPANSPTG